MKRITTERQRELYQRALDAEPVLRAMACAVDTICTLVRKGDALCAGCVCEAIIKPLVHPWVGWGRGYPAEQAKDVPRFCASLAELVAEIDVDDRDRSPATTETERWLRTSEAFDAVTDEWLGRRSFLRSCGQPGHQLLSKRTRPTANPRRDHDS